MPGWTEQGNSCYFKSVNRFNLITAQLNCEMNGSYIASINDQLEFDFITSFASDILTSGSLWVMKIILRKELRKKN